MITSRLLKHYITLVKKNNDLLMIIQQDSYLTYGLYRKFAIKNYVLEKFDIIVIQTDIRTRKKLIKIFEKEFKK